MSIEAKKESIHLIRDTIRQVLEAIILPSRVRAITLLDQVPHIIRRLAVRLFEDEPVLEVLNRFWLEAWQTIICQFGEGGG